MIASMTGYALELSTERGRLSAEIRASIMYCESPTTSRSIRV